MARSVSFLLALCAVLACAPLFAEVTATATDEGVTVKIDGELFANYVKQSGNKPIIWPIIGPTGKEVTRQYPMRKAAEGERGDHPHHRSFWFTHGEVNGISFWHEGDKTGTIRNREITDIRSGKTAGITTINDWLGPDGKKVCEETSRYTFGGEEDIRWIDGECTLRATEGEVLLGDTKEGSFGVRTAGTMKVDAKQGGKIVNAQGLTDAAAWGQASEWVDYHGPVAGETLGIAILNHPSSFRHPTYWHVRTYGLFAANPFGLNDFQRGKGLDGKHVLKKGESITLRHRVIFHKGDEKDASIAKAFAAYAKQE